MGRGEGSDNGGMVISENRNENGCKNHRIRVAEINRDLERVDEDRARGGYLSGGGDVGGR